MQEISCESKVYNQNNKLKGDTILCPAHVKARKVAQASMIIYKLI